MFSKLAQICDKIVNEKVVHKFEAITIIVAMLAFCFHILLVFLANTLDNPSVIIAAVGKNYFATIFTPFSIILFFEVLLLVFSLSKSMTKSIMRQYEIISLIVILRVFKDVSQLESLKSITANMDILKSIALDISVGLLLFALVAIFHKSTHVKSQVEDNNSDSKHENYIKLKKTITLFLIVLLTSLLVATIINWLSNVLNNNFISFFDVQRDFFEILFTILIFADIVLVLLSYAFINDYAMNFRNIAFIATVILIRLSVTADRPFDLILAVGALGLGILINIIYQFLNLSQKKKLSLIERLF